MKLLKYGLMPVLVWIMTSCLSHVQLEDPNPQLHAEQYEVYLKQALYASFNGEDKDPLTSRNEQLAYYTTVTGDAVIATLIYDEALKYNIEPALAFSVAFNESSFNPRAVNRNRDSIDRGVFQLNSKSFPHLTEEEFFSPEINSPLGIAYLRYCLDIGGNEVAALAMYNAGPNRVKDSRTPKMTLDYISKIQEYSKSLKRGIIPDDFNPALPLFPDSKSVKNVTLLMEQSGKIN